MRADEGKVTNTQTTNNCLLNAFPIQRQLTEENLHSKSPDPDCN